MFNFFHNRMLISIRHKFVKIILNYSRTFLITHRFCGRGVKIWRCDLSSFRNRIVNCKMSTFSNGLARQFSRGGSPQFCACLLNSFIFGRFNSQNENFRGSRGGQGPWPSLSNVYLRLCHYDWRFAGVEDENPGSFFKVNYAMPLVSVINGKTWNKKVCKKQHGRLSQSVVAYRHLMDYLSCVCMSTTTD